MRWELLQDCPTDNCVKFHGRKTVTLLAMTPTAQPPALRNTVFAAISKLTQEAGTPITDATPLIGDGSVLDSMRLVELCLSLEDLAGEHGFEFDWTSEAAMSRSRSIFRNAGALADEFVRQSQGAA